MNKPTTLREEAEVAFFLFLDKHRDGYSHLDICNFFSDFWLSKFTSHYTELLNKYENCPQCTGLRDEFKAELLQKIEERQKLFNFIPQDKYGYKRIKATDLDIISLINQYK